MSGARDEAIAWRRAQDELTCDTAEPWAHGTVYRTPSVPDFWDGNFVRVDDWLDGLAMFVAAEELLAGCAHRKLDVTDEDVGAAARAYFATLEWMNERLAMMRRTGPVPDVRGHEVLEVPVEATRNLRAEWYAEYEGDDYDSQLEFARSQEPILARRAMRAFMVADVGFVTLACGAEIDQLYVTPEARGDGIGGALLSRALQAASEDVMWVVADDEGRALALYERFGFETVWRPYAFVRPSM
jgi:GNAT superfamily N-acetyltransferase